MLAIPGKACGECSFCCKVLEIAELAKPAGKLCEHCLNAGSGGCGIYAGRPQVCRDYECLWKGDRDMSPRLRPDRTGTILMEDPDLDEYRAVCDPEKPLVAEILNKVLNAKREFRERGKLKKASRIELIFRRLAASALKGDVGSAAALLKMRAHAEKHHEIGPTIIRVVGRFPEEFR